jgi:hypothetical protein
MLTTNFNSITVASNTLIELNSGTFNLPTAGTLNFPLLLNGGTLGNIPNNDLTITSTGTLYLLGTTTPTFNNLTIDGKIYQWNNNGSTLVNKIGLSILGNLNIGSTGIIDATGKGYYNGGQAFGTNYGASHGGKGGSTIGGTWLYDSVTNPSDLGGAGYSSENFGGGLIDLNVSGTFTLNGSLKANGYQWGSDRGGAGGSIKVNTNTIAGSTGFIQANGNATSHGGAGGRIAIHYTTDTFTGGIAALTKETNGGFSGYGASYTGGEGTMYIKPKLDLNFTTGTLPGNVNFSRSSSGSYYNASGVLSTAASNQPRFDFNPATYSSLGLLIEPQRTNLLLYGEDLSNAFWTKQDTTVAQSDLAPDAATIPYKVAETTTTSFHSVGTTLSLSASQSYVLSFYAKVGERNWIAVSTGDLAGTIADSYINLATGATGTVQHANVTVQTITNGWYRVFVKFNSNSGGSTPTIAVGTATGDGAKSFAGTTGSGIYVWGLQVELGSYGTSYIQTTGATVTRSADVASVTDLSWLVSGTGSLGTFALDVQVPFVAYNMPFLQLDNGSNSSSHRLGLYSSTYSSHYLMQESATTYADITNGTWVNGDRKKLCVSFKPGAARLTTAGLAATAAAPTTMPDTGLSTLRLGADHIGTSFSGHLLRLQYSRDAFNNETCRQITQ